MTTHRSPDPRQPSAGSREVVLARIRAALGGPGPHDARPEREFRRGRARCRRGEAGNESTS
ncbi:hypothetical protein [Kitasatospora sp. NPDC047058]|uniref:hypothetical protein n=1 Tax=Kitasatospora sp. NPDC047058 TaxID=3155620 RepID=UPI0033DC5C02